MPIGSGQPDKLRGLPASPRHPHLLCHKSPSPSSKTGLHPTTNHRAPKHDTLSQQLRDPAEKGQKVGEGCRGKLCLRRRKVTFILRLSMAIVFHLMVCMLPKQERESVPQASPGHHCQNCLQTEHTDAPLVARIKQLLDEACKSLPILAPMGRLASCTPSSCIELAKKIPQLGRVEAS